MNNKVNQMSKAIGHFLCQHGNIQTIKSVDRRILQVENKLNNRLLRLQAGVEAEFIKEIKRRGYLPNNIADRRGLLSKVLGVPFSDMKTAIADDSLLGADVGRQLTFEDFTRVGFEYTKDSFKKHVQEKLWNKVYQFSEDTFKRIEGDFIKTLAEGYEEGYGIDEVVSNLRHDFKNLRDHRLQTIARTEIQGAQNEGSHQTMLDYSVNYKQWLTAGDDRVRGINPNDYYDHIALHGQVVEIDEPYSNGMYYPSDRRGDIGDWINCRCRERPYIPKRGEIILTTPYYP